MATTSQSSFRLLQVALLTAALSVTFTASVDAAKRFERNAVSKIDPAKLKPGQNLIDRAPSGFSLYCIARKGRPLQFIIKDPKGNVIPTTSTRSATTCWECGKDEGGNTHCWKVPCPVITGPWVPGGVIDQKVIQ